MSFIGIITNSKNEEYIIKSLSKFFPTENIVFITDKNTDSIKNIKFETVVIDSKIKDLEKLKQIVSRTRYIILNTDLMMNLEVLEDLDLTIITYGFNNKATFTVSSVSETNIIICLQRIIKNIFNEKYEPQEFEIKNYQSIDIHVIMYNQIIQFIYQKKDSIIE